MGDEDRGLSGLTMDFAQPLTQIASNLCVQCAEGLIEQEHTWFDCKRPSKRNALALAARQLRRITVCKSGQLN